MAKKKIKLPKDLQGNEYYPATTTDAVVHPERKESATVIIDTLATDVNELKSDLIEKDEKINEIDRNKVDREDNAPKLTAGFANNLVGRGEATPQEISFRPSGGDTSIEDGTARIERVKGSTVVWNQRINYSSVNTRALGLSITGTSEGISVSGAYTGTSQAGNIRITYSNKPIPVGHLYLCTGNTPSLKLRVQGAYTYDGVYKAGEGALFDVVIRLADLTQGGEVNITFKPTLVDLTQMFGAGNEPTTIEEFHARKPIGIDEYAYNEGELISANVEELKSVGFNAWDEEWEKGGLSPITGTEEYNQNLIRAKNYIQILPSTIYYCSNENRGGGEATWVMFFDGQKNLIKGYKTGRKTSNNAHDVLNHSFTTPATARYMRFYAKSKVYYHDICIHLAHTGYRNGEYEPYKEFRRSIPIKDIKDKDGNQLFPNGLLSAGSVYDEITATKAIKRIGMVDLGTLNWGKYSEHIFKISSSEVDLLNMARNPNTLAPSNMLCSMYQPTYDTSGTDKGMRGPFSVDTYAGAFHIKDTSYTDAAIFKAAMSGVMLYYELAEPIEIDLEEPLNLDYEVSDFGTEEVISDAPTTPMKADIIYQFNAVDRIRDNSRHTAEAEIKLKDYDTRIAALEAIVASLTSSE